MKGKTIKVTILIIIAISTFITSCTNSNQREINVMVWNIFHGGHDDGLPEDGRPDVIQIIKDAKADIVLMIETYGSAPMIADSLGFNYELLSSNLCIYSRYPITKKLMYTDQIPGFNFGGAEIMVDDQLIRVYDTWLHYLPDTRLAPLDQSEDSILAWENAGSRDDEIYAIMKAIASEIGQSDSIPIIMGGDFNSHSHLDWTDETKGMYNHGNAVVDWTVSKTMAINGFQDAFRTHHPDPVKNIGTTWMSARDDDGKTVFNRKDRIDYIYYQGKDLELIESNSGVAPFSGEFEFEGRKYKHFPSDHGFVLAKFKLSGKPVKK